MQNEMFDSAVRDAGDMAGVFEYEDGVGYFYLYEMIGDEGKKVLDSIHIITGNPDFDASDITIAWDAAGNRVGLFIRRILWAAFEVAHHRKGGGRYMPGAAPELPVELSFALPVN